MNIYLIAGNNCEPIKNALEKNCNIRVSGYNSSICHVLKELSDIKTEIDQILLTDQGINCSPVEFEETLGAFGRLADTVLKDTELKLITRDLQNERVFKSASGGLKNFRVYYIDRIKIPVSRLVEICLEPREEYFEEPAQTGGVKGSGSGNRIGLLFNRPENGEDTEDCKVKMKSLHPIPDNISRVVAVTGHRGAGVTSTVANLAVGAGLCGLRTIVLDFDIEYRGMNLYFNKFGEEADTNPDMTACLIKCLLKPDSTDSNSCRISEKLQVATLAYSLDSRDKLLDYINIKRILNLITILKTRYNVVFIDLPMSFLKKYPGMLIHIDSIGLCINNSLHSVISTVKCITGAFEKEDMEVFGIKSKAVITRYNESNRHQGKKLTPELTCAVTAGISEDFDPDLECAGTVPYHRDFDSQIACGKKLCTSSKEYREHYMCILKNLL